MPLAVCVGIQIETSGMFFEAATDPAEHCALISTALTRAEALSVKSTGCAPLIRVNVAVTGAVVPNGNAGIVTLALDELTTV